MDITRAEQIALDDALVAPTNRLKIGKSNIRLSSDLKSKEATLQVVYDVLKLTPFYKAFQITADVPEIYMQEFWATATIHHHSIRFKMKNKKHIVNLEEIKVITDVNVNKLHQPWRSFVAVISKCLSGKSIEYDSLRLSQAQILWGMYHKKNVDYAYLLWEDFVYQVDIKNAKRDNEMYYPRFTKLYGAIFPNELKNEAIKDSESYKDYYAIALGAEPLKTKASVKKKQVRSDQAPKAPQGKKLKTSVKAAKPAKKKQPARTSKTKGLTVLSESSEEEDDNEVGMNDNDDDNDDDDDETDNKDNDGQDDKSQDDDNGQIDSDNDGYDFVHPKFSTHDQDERQDEEDSFDPRVQTPSHVETTNDEENDEEIQGVNVEGDKLDEEETNEEDEGDELYRLRDEAQAENKDFINKLYGNIKKIIKDQVKKQVKAQVSKILLKFKQTVNEQLEAEVLTCSSNESKKSYVVATNLSEFELKKILIDKMESNMSIHRFGEQKNIYKALVDAYKSYKLILDTYGDTVTFKRRRDDDKDKELSAGSNRGSKRRRAGKEPESTSAPKEKISKTTGKPTEGSKSHHTSAQADEPMHSAKYLEEHAHQEFEIGVTKDQPNEETSQLPNWFYKLAKPPSPDHPRDSFNELLDTPLDFSACVMNRLKVDTLTPELLAGPTFKLMKGSCKRLVELNILEEVYKATTDQLDWNNPKGQQYPHDLRKPLLLKPNSQGRQVITFDHFINNNLAYLSGGVSSRKYTTSITKTKAADYGHIK
uniref:Monodehydroascorbate reductase n=1 Tax=Tanacetum cinerariifolium TaxID=118510 RepID=A0A6L2LG60_TANCI|nr:hypothetical protein [Tanacetum cinerariifolium]